MHAHWVRAVMGAGTRDVARDVCALAAVYGLSVGAVLFRPPGSGVATWWPAAGLAAALVVLSPARRRIPLTLGVVVASGLGNLTAGRPLDVATLFGLSNGAEAFVIGLLLQRHTTRRPRLDSPDDYFRTVAVCAAGALTAGAGIGLSVAITGGDALGAARTVTPSHLASTLVILPFALAWHDRPHLGRRLPELVLQATVLGLALLFVFGGGNSLAMAFLPLPLLVWAGLRFGTLVTCAELLTLAGISTFSTARSLGPFGFGVDPRIVDVATGTTQVQSFLACASLLTIPPCLAIAQRAQLLRQLRQEQELVTTTLETTAAIIVMSDMAGTVLRVNATSERLTGFSADEVVGHPFWETPLIPPERRDLVHEMFGQSNGSQVVLTREADVMTRSGERLRVIWNNRVVRDSDGRVHHVVSTGTDVTNERSTTAMLRHLLEAPVATALVGLDEHGRISVFNQGAQELLHLSPDDVLGKPVSMIVASGQPELFISQAEQLARASGRSAAHAHPGPQTSDWTWRDHLGRDLTVSTTISAVENAVGATMGYLCVGRDVTEQRRTQEILVEALEKERHGMERLRRLDAAKSEFVSTVSHELRTPTTSIVGYTEMLRDGSAGEPTPEQVMMLDAIARNGQRLISVASDLLTLSELETGDTSQWERSPVDLNTVVAQAEEAIRPLLAGRNLTVEFEVPDEEVTVLGDAAHLDRVLMNLLSNAVKFTPDGGHVSCRLSHVKRWAQLEVSDTGIGIPEDEQGELFTKFFRSSTAQERAIQGTGLGLSIIDSIVAAHGGDISVRSAHLEGTAFIVRLPVGRRAGARAASPPALAPGTVTTG